MKNFGKARRRLLRALGAVSLGVFSSTATGQDGPPRQAVATPEKALDWVEDEVNHMTNRPTNSYLDGREGWPQLAFHTNHPSERSVRAFVYQCALDWARAVGSGAPLDGIQFRLYYAVLGDTYEYVASWKLTRDMAVAYIEGTIGEDEYIERAQSRLRWRDGR